MSHSADHENRSAFLALTIVLTAALAAGCGGGPPAEDASAEATGAPGGAGQVPDPVAEGGMTVSVGFNSVVLSPAARMQAEKFLCVCGCGLILAECTCTETPGSVDMKQHLQTLVDEGLTPAEIEREMTGLYGAQVLP